MPYPVKWFTAAMGGAPQVNVTHGELVAVLDAVLCDGFNSKSATSVVRTGSTVRVTFASTGHGFVKHQVVLIANATQTDYNGEQRITAVGSNWIEYEIATTPTTPATTGSTITCKVAPLGWEKQFTATNRRVYRSQNVLSNKPVLYIDNGPSSTYSAGRPIDGRVWMAESATDIDTLVNKVPRYSGVDALTDGVLHWYQGRGDGVKSSGGNGGSYNRDWVIVGDDRVFYLFINPTSASGRAMYGFGDFISLKPGDTGNGFLMAGQNSNDDENIKTTGSCWSTVLNLNDAQRGLYLLKDVYGVNNTDTYNPRPQVFHQATLWNPYSGPYYGSGSQNLTTRSPNVASMSLILAPVLLMEGSYLDGTTSYRGTEPGRLACMNRYPCPDLEILDDVAGMPDKLLLAVAADALHSSNLVNNAPDINGTKNFFDLTGPWF